jgi:AraC-like DNA-binding protein
MAIETSFKYCGKLAGRPSWRMKRHFHKDHHEIIVVLKGVLAAEIGGQQIRGSAGHVLFYPAGASHKEYADENLQLETYFIGMADSGRAQRRRNPGTAFDRHGRIRVLAQWMHERSHAGQRPDTDLLNRLAYAAIREWEFLIMPAEPDFVQAARQFTEKNLTRPVGLPDLARAAGLSVSRFAHAFKEKTGTAPVEYLRRRRMEHGRSLLLSTPLPIKEIAEQCGCADQYVFSKMFKRVMGMPPGSLRKNR